MPEKHFLPKASGDDDTEGHLSRRTPQASGEDDTEGHLSRRTPQASGEDDTEGHFMPPSPGLARQLSSARDEEIQRNAKARQHVNAAESRRLHNKRGRD
ncbi:MAG: hypothetical protein H0V74_07845 [Chloroflexi bacterium]|nr:hypothetical protein [Chloroflexota bacterium]